MAAYFQPIRIFEHLKTVFILCTAFPTRWILLVTHEQIGQIQIKKYEKLVEKWFTRDQQIATI